VIRLILLFAVVGSLAAQPGVDLAVGKKLFQGHCGLCHGQTGTGGKGPSLVQPTLAHAPDDKALARVIEGGIRGTEMPGSFGFTPNELNSLVAYVRSLGRIAVTPLPGDSARGREIYLTKGGCGACHIVRGEGTSLGPELSEIGASRTPEYLREALLKPEAAVPANYLTISVTTREGKTIRGMRVNEDTFTLQMRDAANRIYSFRKADLTAYKKEFNQSLMPSFAGRLSPAEIDDLVAWLASLRGGK
jgi:putative heme-binding domain-containing protein